MSYTQRSLIFFVATMLFLHGWAWLAFLIVAGVALYVNAYEYVILAFCIDVYFAPMIGQFWYTGLTLLILALMFVVRPRLRPLSL